MNLSPLQQTWQLFAWFSALVELILAFYVLGLNFRHSINRMVSALFFIFFLSNFSLGLLLGLPGAATMQWALLLSAAVNPLIPALLLTLTITLLHPEWWQTRLRGLGWGFLAVTLLPVFLTVIDALFGTSLWYTGAPDNYTRGFLALHEYTGGMFGAPLRVALLSVLPALTLAGLLYAVWRDQTLAPSQRRLAALLLAAQAGALLMQWGLWGGLGAEGAALTMNTLLAGVYAYATLRQMLVERRLQRGSLRVRLTALVLVIALPILAAVVLLLTDRARVILEQTENRRLEAIHHSLEVHAASWLDFNITALEQLVYTAPIVGMEPDEQIPALQSMVSAYRHLSLVSTLNLSGWNVARSDSRAAVDYSTRRWFNDILSGEAVAVQVLVSRTLGRPVLVIAMPIRDTAGTLVGVGMMEIMLTDVVHELRIPLVGEAGVAYIIDSEDNIVAHPNPSAVTRVNRVSNPAVTLLRRGERGAIQFDWSGEQWWGYVGTLNNGWGVVVQQPAAEVTATLIEFRRLTLGVMGVAALLILAFIGMAVNQAFAPINELTDTARAIAQGDISRIAPVQSEDEIGALAHAFNSMTTQLRDSIATLELRVTERTRELERRAEYLAVTGGVSRVVASILEVDDLLDRVALLISERFNFYHTGIFLVDASGDWAVLRTVSSAGGRKMLERGHRLRVGEQGIVGYVSGTGRPRIALDVDADTVWVKNPDLPQTRSEMALPLVIGDQVIGVLDVQSIEAEAFTMEDVTTLQILADQIAVAIQNARLFRESRQALREMQRAYGQQIREGWERRVQTLSGYRYTPTGREMVTSDAARAALHALGEGTHIRADNTLVSPLRLVGGTTFGVLQLRREVGYPWSTREIDFVTSAAQDIAQALEVARLFEETRHRADRDRLVGDIGAQLRASLDPDAILRMALQELSQVLGAPLATLEITGVQSPGGQEA